MGLGLRQPHFSEIIETKPDVPWFEALADNYFGDGGLPLCQLEQVRSHYPMVFHCVGMNLGSVDPLDTGYFEALKRVIKQFEPAWVSDHLCWTGVAGKQHHDLLPLPYTDETVRHVADRILKAQELLGRQILIENASSYIQYRDFEMTEWEFLTEVARRSDCLILLDINNMYVNSVNHGFNPSDYLTALPRERVHQLHLAGYDQDKFVLIDTHGEDVAEPVWRLYREALQHFGPVPTSIERDNSIPGFEELLAEKAEAERWMRL